MADDGTICGYHDNLGGDCLVGSPRRQEQMVVVVERLGQAAYAQIILHAAQYLRHLAHRAGNARVGNGYPRLRQAERTLDSFFATVFV